VVTAWESEERLIGLARAVGDGESILFIQDLLVHPEYQGQGVGKALLKEIMAMYPQVPKKLILADTKEALNAFYLSSGFIPVTDKGMTAWIYEGMDDAQVTMG
jgi:GNAT superfamily N-acetyltransferase